MKKKNRNVFVIGLDYQVRTRIKWQDAVEGILEGTMVTFKAHPTKRIRSAGGSVNIAMPEMVLLKFWTDPPKFRKIDKNSKASRYDILKRDGHTCCYCGKYGDTVDHVKPESWCKRDKDPFNGWTWGNLVTACKPCNNKKGDRLPEQAGMKMLWSPYVGDEEFSDIQLEVNRILEEGTAFEEEDDVF